MTDIEHLAAKVQTFHDLHAGPEMLVMANAWDAVSAQRVEAAGFTAIATTSGGVAQAVGYADHEAAPVEEMLAAAARIVRAVKLPVTVDFEAGYGLSPSEIARRLIDIGATGLNLEDTDHRGAGLVPAEAHVERLAEVKAQARALGVDLFLNARVDVFIQREGSKETQLAEGLRRARLYREAGADCIYPIGLSDPTAIRALVDAVQMINITVWRGGPISVTAGSEAGARRATYATSVFRESITIGHTGAFLLVCLDTRQTIHPLDFHKVTTTLLKDFEDQDISYACTGGFALGFWGAARSTIDMDFLILLEDIEKAERVLDRYHYRCHYKSENVAQYVSALSVYGSIDVIFAFRGISRKMLLRSVQVTTDGGVTIRSLIPEDIIGLKLQAQVNDPRRESRDQADIEALLLAMNQQQASINWLLLKEYYDLFDRSSTLTQLQDRYGNSDR